MNISFSLDRVRDRVDNHSSFTFLKEHDDHLFVTGAVLSKGAGQLAVCQPLSKREHRFEPLTVPHERGIRGLAFVTTKHLYAASNDAVYVTYNQGRSWSQTGPKPGTSILGLIAWGDALVVCGDKGVYTSTNEGKSWKRTFATDSDMFSLFVDDHNQLWCCGKEEGRLVCMQDNGSIKVPRAESYAVLNKFSHTPDGHLVLCGDDAKIFRSEDQGRSWQESKVPISDGDLEDIAIVQGRIICVGHEHNDGYKGIILCSDDDGRSFQVLERCSGTVTFWSLLPVHDGAYISAQWGEIYHLSMQRPHKQYTDREPKGR